MCDLLGALVVRLKFRPVFIISLIHLHKRVFGDSETRAQFPPAFFNTIFSLALMPVYFISVR